jgi:antitoxin (DNA-binding transcriptional repressor) of toxin-antitoxin stability system
MRKIGAYEAKTKLSQLLDDVEKRRERILIMRNKKPVAELRPVAAETRLSPAEAAAGLRKLSNRLRLRGLKIRDLIDEGRRF